MLGKAVWVVGYTGAFVAGVCVGYLFADHLDRFVVGGGSR